MLSLALACGGLAASEVSDRAREVEARVGSPVPVLVASRGVPAGEELGEADLELREVPKRYAPADALSSPADAVGSASAAPLAKGAYLTVSALGAPGGAGEGRAGVLRRGERALEVAVAGGGPLAGAALPGTMVDVVVSTEGRERPGRTFLALERVELLDLRAGEPGATPAESGPAEGPAATASAVATLRVTLRQAVYLTAAQNFAREVRLLPRPTGDRSRAGRNGVFASDL